MKNSDYWKQRFIQLENAQNNIGADALAEIDKQYKAAQKQIEADIDKWYARIAANNNVRLEDARKFLSSSQLKEFHWTVDEYIAYGRENAVNQKWMKELENASAKFHISRLEALKINVQNSLETLYASQNKTVFNALQNVYKNGYYRTAFELQRGFNIGFDVGQLDQKEIEKILSKPWAPDEYNFSERIWKNKDKLINEVHKELTQNVMLGKDPQIAINSLAKKMNTSKYNAGRLVMTEEAYFSSAAQKDCFNDLDVEQYQIVATLDSITSDICRKLDGKIYDMKGFQAGVTAPPFHVWCRSTTIPYFSENFGQIGQRAARGEDKKTYYVPANMTYKEWEKTFVNGGDKSELQEITDIEPDDIKAARASKTKTPKTSSHVKSLEMTEYEEVTIPDLQNHKPGQVEYKAEKIPAKKPEPDLTSKDISLDDLSGAGVTDKGSSLDEISGAGVTLFSKNSLTTDEKSSTIKSLDDLKIIPDTHTLESDLAAVNPNYSKDILYQQNCGYCVAAYELRRRGFDVTAMPSPALKGNVILPMFEGYESNSKLAKGSSKEEIINDIVTTAKSWGNGARGLINIKRLNKKRLNKKSGHYFTFEVVNNNVLFLDPQNNSKEAIYYFRKADLNQIIFARLDNLKLTENVLKAVKNKE